MQWQLHLDMPWQVTKISKNMCNGLLTLTVTRMQCKSICSLPFMPAPPRMWARRRVLFTRRMLMSFSQQKAWMRVKCIWSATSFVSSSSVAKMHNTTLSGSLNRRVEILVIYTKLKHLLQWLWKPVTFRKLLYLHIEWLCSLVDPNCNTSLR